MTGFTKKEIKSKFKGPESTLDNALFALRDDSIILAKEGERGVYRLQHKGFGMVDQGVHDRFEPFSSQLPNITDTGQQPT